MEPAGEQAGETDQNAHLADEVIGHPMQDLGRADRSHAGFGVCNHCVLVAKDLVHKAERLKRVLAETVWCKPMWVKTCNL